MNELTYIKKIADELHGLNKRLDKIAALLDKPPADSDSKGPVIELDGKEISKAVSQSVRDKVQEFRRPQSDSRLFKKDCDR